MEHRDEEAFRAVEEAGGGESEGFEQAEELLIEHAENTSGEGAPRLEEIFEADDEEAPPDDATYGEADQEEKDA
jgi:hypothetical protein